MLRRLKDFPSRNGGRKKTEDISETRAGEGLVGRRKTFESEAQQLSQPQRRKGKSYGQAIEDKYESDVGAVWTSDTKQLWEPQR